MDIFLLALSALGSVIKNLISRAGGASFNGLRRLGRTNFITATVTLIFLCFFGFDINIVKANPALFLLLAALYAIFTSFSQIFFVMAVERGSVAITTLITSTAFLIPTFFSVIFYNEKLTYIRLIGIALLLLCVFLVTDKPTKTNGGIAFLLFVLGAALMSGAVGILQRVYVMNYPAEGGLNEYLFVSFLIMAVIALFQWMLCERKTKHLLPKEKSRYAFVLPSFVMAACLAYAHKVNLYLSSVLPSTLFFPVINVSVICLTAVGAIIFFREKFSKRKICGLALSVIAILIVSFG